MLPPENTDFGVSLVHHAYASCWTIIAIIVCNECLQAAGKVSSSSCLKAAKLDEHFCDLTKHRHGLVTIQAHYHLGLNLAVNPGNAGVATVFGC